MNSSRKEETALRTEGWQRCRTDESTGFGPVAQATEKATTRAPFKGTAAASATAAAVNGLDKWDTEEVTKAGGVCLLIA